MDNKKTEVIYLPETDLILLWTNGLSFYDFDDVVKMPYCVFELYKNIEHCVYLGELWNYY